MIVNKFFNDRDILDLKIKRVLPKAWLENNILLFIAVPLLKFIVVSSFYYV